MAKSTPKKADAVKSLAGLEEELATKQLDIIAARKSHKAGELVNPRVLGQTRKDIARLLTAINNIKTTEVK